MIATSPAAPAIGVVTFRIFIYLFFSFRIEPIRTISTNRHYMLFAYAVCICCLHMLYICCMYMLYVYAVITGCRTRNPKLTKAAKQQSEKD